MQTDVPKGAALGTAATAAVCVFITARAGGATGSRQVAQCGRTATSYTLYSRPSP